MFLYPFWCGGGLVPPNPTIAISSDYSATQIILKNAKEIENLKTEIENLKTEIEKLKEGV